MAFKTIPRKDRGSYAEFYIDEGNYLVDRKEFEKISQGRLLFIAYRELREDRSGNLRVVEVKSSKVLSAIAERIVNHQAFVRVYKVSSHDLEEAQKRE